MSRAGLTVSRHGILYAKMCWCPETGDPNGDFFDGNPWKYQKVASSDPMLETRPFLNRPETWECLESLTPLFWSDQTAKSSFDGFVSLFGTGNCPRKYCAEKVTPKNLLHCFFWTGGVVLGAVSISLDCRPCVANLQLEEIYEKS